MTRHVDALPNSQLLTDTMTVCPTPYPIPLPTSFAGGSRPAQPSARITSFCSRNSATYCQSPGPTPLSPTILSTTTYLNAQSTSTMAMARPASVASAYIKRIVSFSSQSKVVIEQP